MRVIVLGGTRFIGRALVAELVGAGHEVLVVRGWQPEQLSRCVPGGVSADEKGAPLGAPAARRCGSGIPFTKRGAR